MFQASLKEEMGREEGKTMQCQANQAGQEKSTSKNKVHKNPTISSLVYLQEYSSEHTIYGESSF